jgi:hypothetical protein
MRAAVPESEHDRLQFDAGQLAFLVEHHLRHDAFPEFLVRRESARVFRRSCIVVIGGSRRQRQVELIVIFLRLELHQLVLENEVRQAVKNRFAFVNLDPLKHVGSMADEQIGTGIDGGLREGDQELGRVFAIARRAFVRMN